MTTLFVAFLCLWSWYATVIQGATFFASTRYLEEETFIPTQSELSDLEMNDVVKFCTYSKFMPDLSPMVQDGCAAFLRFRRN
uniref:Uncharacterized protein n=1 Tax=Plectus sambesii TaxID=2011161 RepID=A0A914X946_9BILA